MQLAKQYSICFFLLSIFVHQSFCASDLSEVNRRLDQQQEILRLQAKEIESLKLKLETLLRAIFGQDDDSQENNPRKKRDISDIILHLPAGALAGIRGAPGRDGRDGAPGQSGPDGIPGRDGVNGADGRDGLAGIPGAPGVPGRDCKAGNSGAVYTRWGRTTCGNDSTLIYHGFTGGEYYTTSGGGVNYQCLPMTPEYNPYSGGAFQGTFIRGAEYQVQQVTLLGTDANQQNVPCARCDTNSRSAVMMYPAKKTCPNGWYKEYEGYLMTERNTHQSAKTYECVDGNPEYLRGLSSNDNGALFYFVGTDCAGVGKTGQCPPYIENHPLSCVVCSK